jgi:general stress protein 26
MTLQHTSDISRFWELVKDIRFGMLTARHSDGTLQSRPMTTQNGKDDRRDVLWFFAQRDSEGVLDLAQDPEVNVAYTDPDKDVYVSVAGAARLVEDPAKAKAMWGPINQSWFPGGPSDPNLALIEVKIAHVEYWDVKNSHIVQLFKMATAAATARKPDLKTEHGEIEMRRR